MAAAPSQAQRSSSATASSTSKSPGSAGHVGGRADSDDAGRRLRYRRDRRDPDRDRDRSAAPLTWAAPTAPALVTVAALLVEQEMEGRRHGYLSLLYGFKWQGRVDGEEVSPLDLVFSGWSHALPRADALELVVAVG
eukprot:XP_001701293.1 predicted protein [Chlamydomonas reinhardtii]